MSGSCRHIWEEEFRTFTTAFFTLTNVFLQVQKDNVAPIYVINLLISDLIQFCCMIGFLAQPGYQDIYQIGGRIYFSSLVASVYFMVCIALERYLSIQNVWSYFCV